MMYQLSILTIFLAFLHVSLSLPDVIHMESSVTVFTSSKWTKLEPHHLKDDHVVQAIFVLQYDSAEIEVLEKMFHDLSEPTSKSYGKWVKVRTIKNSRSIDVIDNVQYLMSTPLCTAV